MFSQFTLWHLAYILIATHLTILTVTIYLHRGVAHRSITLAKPIEHLFRFWNWVTTGQSPQEWAAVHRKHHAFCEQEQDPHSPKIHGIWTVLFKGVLLYKKEAKNTETIQKYGKFTPNDWIEKNLYRKFSFLGLVLLAIFNLSLFGFHGIWMYLLQIVWIPFWAAGVINGVAHHRGYRNFNTADQSTNISPIGFIIGGEELHNNHHAYPTSAKFSMRWFEFDIGWFWISVLKQFNLVTINKITQLPTFNKQQKTITEKGLETLLQHKSFVFKIFQQNTKLEVQKCIKEIKLKHIELQKYSTKKLKHIFYESYSLLKEKEKDILHKLLDNKYLKLAHECKEQIGDFWSNKTLNMQILKTKMTDFCHKIKNSGHQSLENFANHLIWIEPNIN